LPATEVQVEGFAVVNESLTNSGVSEATLPEKAAVIVVVPVEVATAHQISSVITPFTVSTYRCASCHAPVLGQVTPEIVMLCEWICEDKTRRSPTFCGLTDSDVSPADSALTGKVAASVMVLAAGAALSSPKVRTDVINAMDMMHFNTTRAAYLRVQWSMIIERLLQSRRFFQLYLIADFGTIYQIAEIPDGQRGLSRYPSSFNNRW
jgi:hypothetical protein